MAVHSPARVPVRVRPHSSLIGCLLLAALGLVMSLQVAVAMTPLRQADERAHAGYAIVLAHGHLPTIDTPIPDDPRRYPGLVDTMAEDDQAHREIWTANHPPLYYALSVPLVYLGDALGHPGFTLVGMRALNGLGFALTILLVGLLARELAPRRPLVPLVASAITLSCGAITYLGGAIYNDGPATAAAFGALLAGIRMIRLGVTRPRLAIAVVAGVAAAAFRSSGLVAVLATGAAVLAAVLLRDPTRRGLGRGIALAAVIGAAPAAAIGWFYVRNIRLYGDATASGALYEKFLRVPNGTAAHLLTDPPFYRHLLGSLWTDGDLPNRWGALGFVLAALTVIGLVVDARLRAAPSSAAGTIPPDERRRLLAARLVIAGYSVVTLVSVAGFIAGGGWIHARYAVPFLPALATPAAVALLALGRFARSRITTRRPGLHADPDDDLPNVLPIVFVLIGLALLAHFDTERLIDRHVDNAAGAGFLVVSDLVVLAAAVGVVRRLRRLRPGLVDSPGRGARDPAGAATRAHG